MEVFNVHDCSESGINLKSEKQLETLLEKIKDSEEVMIRWEDEDENDRTEILITDNLMSRVKDGRFRLTSTRVDQE